MPRTTPFLLLLLFLTTTAGCGGTKAAPVDGKVKFKDGSDVSVLTNYEISFAPADGKTSAVGHILADGSFQLSTFSDGDGALPGQHRIAISPPLSPDPDKPPQKSKLSPKYADGSTSGLTADIKPGRNTVNLELERLP
jgi:hypothetical protein